MKNKLVFPGFTILALWLITSSYGVRSDAIPDKHKDCQHWAEVGECDNNPNYMQGNCATSCEKVTTDKKRKETPNLDKDENCGKWAVAGECDNNPGYMLENCVTSCEKVQNASKETERQMQSVSSIYDLSEKDIYGNVLNFESLRNQVVIIANVASYCGYTESHYKGLVQLWNSLHPYYSHLRILAFPCNQFGNQEPESNENVLEFARNKGVTFTMMDKIEVNGPNASLVYRYLKSKAGIENIGWNFGTYFVISRGGDVKAFTGVDPMSLMEFALNQLPNKDEL